MGNPGLDLRPWVALVAMIEKQLKDTSTDLASQNIAAPPSGQKTTGTGAKPDDAFGDLMTELQKIKEHF